MIELTQFIAQIMWPIFLLICISLLVKRESYEQIFKDLSKDDLSLFTFAIAETSIGIAIIVQHCLWWSIFEILISLLALWFILEWALVLLWLRSYIQWVLWCFYPSMIIFWAWAALFLWIIFTWAWYFYQ